MAFQLTTFRPGLRIATALLCLPVSLPGLADDPLEESRCGEAAAEQLSKWQSKNEFLPSSDTSTEINVFRSPTAELGSWVVMTIKSGRIGRLLRISPDTESEIRFDDQCRATATIRSRAVPDDDRLRLGDDDVARVVSSNHQGVFYAWSPHMPLSVEGYKEIAAAAETLKIAVTPVLSSHANVDYAIDRALRVNMPDQALAINRSIELTMRDFNVHAPAILIYANGAFVSPVMPGFRSATDYESLIARYLKD